MQQTAATMPEERKAATLEDVWAVMREVGEKQKELAEIQKELAESQKELAESQKETDRQMQESGRRMDELSEKTNKKLGELGRRFGEIVEHLIAPNLIEKLNTMNFDFRIASPNRKYYDSKHQELAEVDVLLENTKIVMAIEVKSKLLASHVQDHLERMDILRAYADEHDDRRVWLGAVGGALLATDARKAALKAGFYLIEQSGDTVMISVPEGFKPKEWTFRMRGPSSPC
jgi:predicted nuclease with TOPRIM domain